PGTLNLSAVETVLLMAYNAAGGDIYTVAPFIQATLTKLTNAAFYANTGLDPVTGASPVFCQGFNMGFVAMGDLLLPKSGPLVYLPITGDLYLASDIRFGEPWQPGTFYRIGQIVSPSTFQTFGQPGGQGTWVEQQTGFLYRCTVPGTSGDANHQPAWPTTYEGQVVDIEVTWEECTPIFISGLPDPAAPVFSAAPADGASPIIAGATVYLACTYLNPKGEGTNSLVDLKGSLDATKVLKWANNTGVPVDLTVTLAAIPAYLLPAGPLGASFGATGINLYAFIDPTSSADPSEIIDPTSYALVNNAPLASGANVTI